MAPKRKTASVKEVEAEESMTTEPTAVATPPGSPPSASLQPQRNAAELYAMLQAAAAEDPAKVNDVVQELLQMLAEAESPGTPLLLRVRTLEFISQYGQHVRDGTALKKIVTSLVKILSGSEDTPQLLVAAVQCLSSLGPVSMLDKKWEYLSREGADVLMQVMLDEEGFAEGVRQAASKALDALTHTAFRSVVTKLLHWLSDNRETEEEEQLKKERRLAMSRLSKLAHLPSLQSQWTEEVQENVLSLIVRVLSTVTVQEFAQLTTIVMSLPMVRTESGLPLLKAFLSQNALNTDRALESVGIIGQHISATPYDITPALESAGLLDTSVETNTVRGMWHAKVLLLAARLATPDNTEKLYTAVVAQMAHVMQDGSALPENLTTLEVILLAFIAIGQKKPVETLKCLNDDVFAAKCKKLIDILNPMELLLTYAIKKRMQRSAAGQKEAEVLACCKNVQTILTAFHAKHMPIGTITESWTHKNKLPRMKRGHGVLEKNASSSPVGGRTGALAVPLGVLPSVHGTEGYTRKRARGEVHNNNGSRKRSRGNRRW